MSPFPVWSQKGLCAHTHGPHTAVHAYAIHVCTVSSTTCPHTIPCTRARRPVPRAHVHAQPSAFLACPQCGTWGRRAAVTALGRPAALPRETGCDLLPRPGQSVPANSVE